MYQNCYINVIIAHSDCFALLGAQAILQEHHDISVSACAADFADLSTSAITLHPHVIILDSDLPGLTSPECLEALMQQTHALAVLNEHHLHGGHYYYYFNRTVQGIVCRQQPGHVLIEAIRTVYAGNYYYGPLAKKFFAAYPVAGKAGSPLLKPKEMQVLEHLAHGKTTDEIAALLFSSPDTIKSIRTNLLAKTGTCSATQLVYFAVKNHLIPCIGLMLPWLAATVCDIIDLAFAA